MVPGVQCEALQVCVPSRQFQPKFVPDDFDLAADFGNKKPVVARVGHFYRSCKTGNERLNRQTNLRKTRIFKEARKAIE